MKGQINRPGLKSQLNANAGQSEREGMWTHVAWNHPNQKAGSF